MEKRHNSCHQNYTIPLVLWNVIHLRTLIVQCSDFNVGGGVPNRSVFSPTRSDDRQTIWDTPNIWCLKWKLNSFFKISHSTNHHNQYSNILISGFHGHNVATRSLIYPLVINSILNDYIALVTRVCLSVSSPFILSYYSGSRSPLASLCWSVLLTLDVVCVTASRVKL